MDTEKFNNEDVIKLLNNIDVILHNKNENIVNLFVRRSFAEHLWSWINDSTSRL